jgi:hypothetical protein
MDGPHGGRRLAVVVVNDLQFGLARMYGTLRSMAPGANREFEILRACDHVKQVGVTGG